mgnify:CR=1 FL=1
MNTCITFEDLACACLFQPEVDAKLEATRAAERALSAGRLTFDFTRPPLPATAVCLPQTPTLVDPRSLPRRSLHTPKGLMAFLHAVAHIEFTAIVLAWDMAYRFREMPEDFLRSWLGVAIEEAHHFDAVCARLRTLGCEYGDLPAHRGLWELAEETADDVLHRLALVPRYMEARGLDVTPAMIHTLSAVGDTDSVAILELILREEIGHVALGSHWFQRVAEERGLEPETAYFALVEQYIRGGVRGPFNRGARLSAGFTASELRRLEQMDGHSRRPEAAPTSDQPIGTSR